ncbi:family 16 glycosylhydrolase [Saccharicrinis fermentans]|uniref:Kappa-carrageenase n=1 Tax=Saccharicrinis fermentans DSM 9555 = JCM 21142 TaxID=869213 RepID=W7YHV7_9BACT|nr:family 16 glycosylhydrolase [Saccharicrinis fermentans]GAF02139.1 kappa-carrageenase precursor [Saccharicrinis fermentans DSM 9555 = JCM 21142]
MKKKIILQCLIMLLCISTYAQQPFGLSGNWELQNALSDEFNGGLNTGKWEHDPADWGPWSWKPERTKVSNGKLKLTLDWDKHIRGGEQLYFTSGIIRSKQSIKYGYFEVKMKGAPQHPGVCPAFWTYSIGQPAIVYNGQTIKYNEIDFPEIQQRLRNVKLIDWNVIRADATGKRTSVRETTGGGVGPSFDPRSGYHIYGCLWEKDNIEFYIDGALVATADPTESIYQFHQQHLVISLGLREPYYEYINGQRKAIKTESRPAGFPTTMQVEYVRTWKRSTEGTNTCDDTWKSTATYSLSDEVIYNGTKWKWKSRTDGNCTPGNCGRWRNLGACSTLKSASVYEPSNDVEIQKKNSETSRNIDSGATGMLKVSHNSADDILIITSDDKTNVNIYDINGKVMLSKSFNGCIELDINFLPQGLYIVKVANKVNSVTKKIVK